MLGQQRARDLLQGGVSGVTRVVHDHIPVVQHLRGRVDLLDCLRRRQRAGFSRARIPETGGFFERDQRKRGKVSNLHRGESRVLSYVHVQRHMIPREGG